MATNIKGKFQGVEISENGSAVKIRLGGGDSVKIDAEDFELLTEQLVNALATVKLNQEMRPEKLPNRFEPLPQTFTVGDVNVTHNPDADAYLVEFSSSKGQRLVLHMQPQFLAFLRDTFEKSQSKPSGRELH